MKSITIGVIISAFVLSTPAFADTEITGHYKCTGFDPYSKSSYNSEMSISKLGEAYSFIWKEEDADFSGTGVLSKKMNNILAAEFWSPKNHEKSGVIIYQLKPDGTLEGEWVLADKGEIGTETCKKQ